VNQTHHLQLSLSDFATDEISAGNGPPLRPIPFEQLVNLLARAEDMHQAREPESEGRSIKSARRTKKHRLPSSSPDRLGSEDEAHYRKQETRTAERADAEDGDFRSRARRRKT